MIYMKFSATGAAVNHITCEQQDKSSDFVLITSDLYLNLSLCRGFTNCSDINTKMASKLQLVRLTRLKTRIDRTLLPTFYSIQ